MSEKKAAGSVLGQKRKLSDAAAKDHDGDSKMEDKQSSQDRISTQKRVRTKGRDEVLEGKKIKPSTFEAENHFYPRVLNANVHPMMNSFMNLGNERIATRFHHLHPKVDKQALLKLLTCKANFFKWAGADLFHVTNAQGKRQMIVIETTTCPSGQKSMPGLNEETADGYHQLIKESFLPAMNENKSLPKGDLAVMYDKNPVEAKGYCHALADLTKEDVWLVELYEDDKVPPVEWRNGVMHIRDKDKNWHPIRACFRYVTQRPWNRIPIDTKTLIFNSVVCCLAGGRNKVAADKAYEFFNHEVAETNLSVRTPETIRDVSKAEIPMWTKSMGGRAVIKAPYSSSGQGVWTILNERDLQSFMNAPERHSKYIVQALVGNSTWASASPSAGQYFHTGSIPNKKGDIFVSDLRMMIRNGPQGFAPVCVYARRALLPLAKSLTGNEDTWGMLGTNLSVKNKEGKWETDTNRLLLMDMKDFNRLGIAIDDLIDAYVQTVLATLAIDRMAQRLMAKGTFDRELYCQLNSDQDLIKEIRK